MKAKIDGFWCVYQMTMAHDGDAWYQHGSLLLCFPQSIELNSAKEHVFFDGEDSLVSFEINNPPALVQNMCEDLVARGYGLFDDSYKDIDRNEKSLLLVWTKDLSIDWHRKTTV